MSGSDSRCPCTAFPRRLFSLVYLHYRYSCRCFFLSLSEAAAVTVLYRAANSSKELALGHVNTRLFTPQDTLRQGMVTLRLWSEVLPPKYSILPGFH